MRLTTNVCISLLLVLLPAANLSAQRYYQTSSKKKDVRVIANHEYITKYRRQWIKEREFMLYLNITRMVTLRQPLIGVATFKMGKGAATHSLDMAKKGRFGHYNFKARSQQYNFRGENVILDHRTAIGCFVGWMNSPGHRKNMMSWGYLFSGVGFYKVIKINKTIKNGKVVKRTKKVKTLGTQVFR